jgi:tRNA 5-methylaminomethyl-2-thiouridine biosynthesis bifunctional protein
LIIPLTELYTFVKETEKERKLKMAICWQNHIPSSVDYGDIYFSPEDGLAESHYVFIEGNNLTQRLQQQKNWVIAETGFGTGLNFFASCMQLLPHNRLHFISIEKHPLSIEQIDYALACWPQLKPHIESLKSHYPHLFISPKRYVLPVTERITLELHIGDIKNVLPSIKEKADAWFLDGFAPTKNPDMWEESVIEEIGKRTKENSTIATFTASSKINKRLTKAGYQVTKRKGFGKKREMLTGVFSCIK